MAQTLFEQLSQMTVVVADTGDINAIRKFKPRDATTNPSLIMAAAQMKEYAQVVDDTLGWARKDAGAGAPKDAVIRRAIDRLSVEFGLRILSIVAGRVSTEVDARLSFQPPAGSHQDRLDVGGHPRSRDAGEGGHPLQPHPALRDPSGDRVRRGRRHADLALRRADPRLVQEVDR
jgi:hypothetical protein